MLRMKVTLKRKGGMKIIEIFLTHGQQTAGTSFKNNTGQNTKKDTEIQNTQSKHVME